MAFVIAETGDVAVTAVVVCTKSDEEPVVDDRQTTIPDFMFVFYENYFYRFFKQFNFFFKNITPQ
jgi:hypothetical protein